MPGEEGNAVERECSAGSAALCPIPLLADEFLLSQNLPFLKKEN